MFGIIEGKIESEEIVKEIGRVSVWWFGNYPFKYKTYFPTSEALEVVILIRILDWDARVKLSMIKKEGTVIGTLFFVTKEKE